MLQIITMLMLVGSVLWQTETVLGSQNYGVNCGQLNNAHDHPYIVQLPRTKRQRLNGNIHGIANAPGSSQPNNPNNLQQTIPANQIPNTQMFNQISNAPSCAPSNIYQNQQANMRGYQPIQFNYHDINQPNSIGRAAHPTQNLNRYQKTPLSIEHYNGDNIYKTHAPDPNSPTGYRRTINVMVDKKFPNESNTVDESHLNLVENVDNMNQYMLHRHVVPNSNTHFNAHPRNNYNPKSDISANAQSFSNTNTSPSHNFNMNHNRNNFNTNSGINANTNRNVNHHVPLNPNSNSHNAQPNALPNADTTNSHDTRPNSVRFSDELNLYGSDNDPNVTYKALLESIKQSSDGHALTQTSPSDHAINAGYIALLDNIQYIPTFVVGTPYSSNASDMVSNPNRNSDTNSNATDLMNSVSNRIINTYYKEQLDDTRSMVPRNSHSSNPNSNKRVLNPKVSRNSNSNNAASNVVKHFKCSFEVKNAEQLCPGKYRNTAYSKYKIKIHELLWHSGIQVRCLLNHDHCNNKIICFSQLKCHDRYHHKNTFERKFTCPVKNCDYVEKHHVSNRVTILLHILNDHSSETIKCDGLQLNRITDPTERISCPGE
eukprot:373934_1